MSYLHRIADIQLKERLEAFGAVLIEASMIMTPNSIFIHSVSLTRK